MFGFGIRLVHIYYDDTRRQSPQGCISRTHAQPVKYAVQSTITPAKQLHSSQATALLATPPRRLSDHPRPPQANSPAGACPTCCSSRSSRPSTRGCGRGPAADREQIGAGGTWASAWMGDSSVGYTCAGHRHDAEMHRLVGAPCRYVRARVKRPLNLNVLRRSAATCHSTYGKGVARNALIMLPYLDQAHGAAPAAAAVVGVFGAAGERVQPQGDLPAIRKVTMVLNASALLG